MRIPRQMFAPVKKIEGPTLLEIAENFSAAMLKLAADRFRTVTSEQAAERAAICAGCDLWDEKGNLGFGKCNHKKCGCTKYKRWLASQDCPLGKWPKIS